MRRLRQEERLVAIEEHVEHAGAADRGYRAATNAGNLGRFLERAHAQDSTATAFGLFGDHVPGR